MPDKDKEGPQGDIPKRSRRPAYLGGAPSPEEAAKAPEGPPEPEEDVVLLTWKVWLLPRRPKTSVLVVSALILAIYFTWRSVQQPLFVLVITGILLNRLAPYLFPVKYTLSKQKAGYKTFMAADMRRWERFFTFHKFPDGVLLANDTRTLRGRIREGLFMHYNTDMSPDDVLSIVASKLPTPQEATRPKAGPKDKGGVGSAIRRVRKLKGQ